MFCDFLFYIFLKEEMHNAMTNSICQTGEAFDYSVKINETVLKNFASSPILLDYLNDNPSFLGKKHNT